MEQWITVKEAARLRKCTERNILDQISKGAIQAKKDGRKWQVFMDTTEAAAEASPQFAEVISVLKGQLQEKDKQIQEKDKQIALLQEQSGQLNQLLAMEKKERLQLIEAKKTWWQRWGKKK